MFPSSFDFTASRPMSAAGKGTGRRTTTAPHGDSWGCESQRWADCATSLTVLPKWIASARTVQTLTVAAAAGLSSGVAILTSVNIATPDDKPAAAATVSVWTVRADAIHFGKTVSDVAQSAHLWDSQPHESPWGAVVVRLPVPLPAALIGRLAVKSNDDGNITFRGVTQEQLAGIDIQAAEFG